MEKYNMASEAFSSGRTHYFFDFKVAAGNRLFLQMTRSDRQHDGTFRRSHIIVFEDDLPLVVQALSSLSHHAMHVEKLPPVIMPGAVRGMKAMAEEDRPRERLLASGPGVLSDAELLALVIGSGSVRESAVELSARLLRAFEGLGGLSRASCNRLQLFEGIGQAKSAQLAAVMELSRRLGRD